MGITIAIIGASLAVALSCVGSGKGVGMVGEASSGVLADDPSKFSACLILQIMPGHDDKRPLFQPGIHYLGAGILIGLGVGIIQHLHDLQGNFSGTHSQAD